MNIEHECTRLLGFKAKLTWVTIFRYIWVYLTSLHTILKIYFLKMNDLWNTAPFTHIEKILSENCHLLDPMSPPPSIFFKMKVNKSV